MSLGISIVYVSNHCPILLSLSILVVLHEFGHFLPAKWFGTKVEKFYLFFDPWFSLFKYKKGETEYGVGWLPLGGYVKIAGMVDESFDMEQMQGEPQDWEFRSKPAWQRLIIMLGGVTVNFLLGFFIFAMLLFAYGEKYLPSQNASYGIAVDTIGYDIGLRDGDHILKIGEKDFERFSSSTLKQEIVLNEAKDILVKRDNLDIRIPVPEGYGKKLASYDYSGYRIFAERIPFIINEVSKKSPAEEIGLKEGDKIIGFNGKRTDYYHEFGQGIKEYNERDIKLMILRDGETKQFDVTLTEKLNLGVFAKPALDIFETETQDFTLGQAFPAGVKKGVDFLTTQIKAFGLMFRGKINVTDSLGGFGTIAKLFPRYWDWQIFWRVTAILSLILGFMNLLPIPALDGGHVMFLIWEVLTGKKPSDKFMETATLVGFIFIIALVLFANGLDVWRGWFK